MSRSKKIEDLDRFSSVSQGDLFIVEKVDGDNTTTGAATANVIFGLISTDVNVASNNKLEATNLVVTKNTTPTSSAGTFQSRQIWFDNDYLYVTINGTTIKRVPLQAF